jgi:DNA-binding NarL/FixJ family response regulator
MYKIRVLIVDDHAILREGIRALLAAHNDIEVVGEAADGREAVEKVHQLSPDVVLMDVAMPLMDGLEATRRIRKGNPNTKVLILTQYDNKEYILSSIKVGAAGCVPKRVVASELVSAIRAVNLGDSFLHPSAAKFLIEDYLQKVEEDPYDSLTDREREILKLVAEGRTNREIADLLSVSVKTVLGHRTSVMEKLDIHNRTELIKYAIRKGLISVDM